MKRTIAVILLLITISVVFVGCSPKANALDMVMDLKTKGFRTTSTFVTDTELIRANYIVKNDVQGLKGTFDVDVVEMYNLTDAYGEDICTFIVFKTKKQAKQYAALKLRWYEYETHIPPYIDGHRNIYQISVIVFRSWKVARKGCVVVYTNNSDAAKAIPMHFRQLKTPTTTW